MDITEDLLRLEDMIKRLAVVVATASHIDVNGLINVIEGDVEKIKLQKLITEDGLNKILDKKS